MHGRLKIRKVCTQWTPRELNDREKMNRVGLSLQHFLRYADGGEDILNMMVTGDESWMHHYQPESRRALVKWNSPVHLQPKCFRFWLSHQLGRLCLPCFGILSEYCWPVFRSMVKIWILHRALKFFWSFGMQFAENLEANWQEAFCFIMTCQTPYRPSYPGENSRTTVGTSWTSALKPGLGP
jgi:hypothetical protein